MAYRRRRRAYSVGSYRTGWNPQKGARGYSKRNPRPGKLYYKRTGRTISPPRMKRGTIRQGGIMRTSGYMDKGLNTTAIRYIKAPGKNYTTGVLKRAHSVHKAMDKPRSIPGVGQVGKINAPTTRMVPSPGHVPYKVSHSREAKNIANSAVARTLHRTHVDTGMPMTQALKDVKKLQGSQKLQYFDTKTNYDVGVLRTLLDHASGFNCKKYLGFPVDSVVTAGDVISYASTPDYVTNDYKREKVLLATEYLETQHAFYNNSAHFPVNMRLHLVKLGDKDLPDASNPQESVNTDCFSTDKDIQDEGAMPNRYQYEDLTLLGIAEGENARRWSQTTATHANPFKSSGSFRSNHEIVKTVSKKLEPGDTWVVRHRHHTGPGLDLLALFQQSQSANAREKNQPISYHYILEFYGVPVEGLRKFSATIPRPYLGCSPAYITHEFRKTIKAVSGATRTIPDIGPVGVNAANIHMRSFIDIPQNASDAREYHALPDAISSDLATIATGEVFIPVMTDKEIIGHTNTGGQTNQ